MAATTSTDKPLCDASRQTCTSVSTVDLGREVQVPGTQGLVRFLCCKHARGLRGHRGCEVCK